MFSADFYTKFTLDIPRTGVNPETWKQKILDQIPGIEIIVMLGKKGDDQELNIINVYVDNDDLQKLIPVDLGFTERIQWIEHSNYDMDKNKMVVKSKDFKDRIKIGDNNRVVNNTENDNKLKEEKKITKEDLDKIPIKKIVRKNIYLKKNPEKS